MKKIMLILLFLAGCAGTPFKWDDARKVKTGMTTTEVTQIIGSPSSVTSRDGILIYVWVYVDMYFSGTKSLRIDFKDNRVIAPPPIPDTFKD